MRSRWAIVATLGSTQALAWASSFYLPAVLAGSIARDVHVTTSVVFAALSVGLGLSAFLGPLVGRLIDERGGALVLCASNVVFAVGLLALAFATGPVSLFCAWLVLGVAMAAGLYEPAFAALARIYGSNSRAPMTGITLIAGFASTIGWPISAFLEHRLGWRGACLSWLVIQVAVALPLNTWALRGAGAATEGEAAGEPPPTVPQPGGQADPRMTTLAFVFTASGIVSIGVATNLPGLFAALGATPTAAIAAASLMGPAQVAARIVEYGAKRWSNPLTSAKVANVLHPVATVALALGGVSSITLFALIHGAGNGILTIARGTLPLALFGAQGYGARIGKIAAPARIGQAIAPFLFGMAIERFGTGMLALSCALSIAAFLALFRLRMPAS
ncbi:MAG: MFS transporter [Proteobacteria bacterium]|nr:MFS transporter [Pseudomonadota bacterium]